MMAAFIEVTIWGCRRKAFLNVEDISSVEPSTSSECTVNMRGGKEGRFSVEEPYEAIKRRICEAVELTPEQPRKVGRSAYELCRETSLKATMERASGE